MYMRRLLSSLNAFFSTGVLLFFQYRLNLIASANMAFPVPEMVGLLVVSMNATGAELSLEPHHVGVAE